MGVTATEMVSAVFSNHNILKFDMFYLINAAGVGRSKREKKPRKATYD